MYLYELAVVNLWQAKYELCKKFAADFLLIERDDRRKIALAKVWIMQADYALTNTTVYDYVITPLSDSVNIFPMQYFPTVTADGEQLIFTARYGGGRNDSEDLVVSAKQSNGSWGAPVSLSANINTIQREGASTINEKEPVLFQPMAAILFLPCVGHRVAICMKAVKQVQCGRDLKTLGPILIAPDGTPNPRYRPMAVNYILFRKEMVALVVMISGIRS